MSQDRAVYLPLFIMCNAAVWVFISLGFFPFLALKSAVINRKFRFGSLLIGASCWLQSLYILLVFCSRVRIFDTYTVGACYSYFPFFTWVAAVAILFVILLKSGPSSFRIRKVTPCWWLSFSLHEQRIYYFFLDCIRYIHSSSPRRVSDSVDISILYFITYFTRQSLSLSLLTIRMFWVAISLVIVSNHITKFLFFITSSRLFLLNFDP